MENKIETSVSLKITFLQFIMSIIVCMGHIGYGGALAPINEIDGYIYRCCQWVISELTGISVHLYMMLAAFLLYYNCDRHNIFDKLYRRVFSLILPYIVWNVIYGIYYWLVEDREIFSINALYQGLLVEPWDGPLWFVLTLIAFLPLIFILGPGKKWWQSLLVVICIVLFLKYGNWDGIPVLSWFCNQWSSQGRFYFAGVLIARICPQVVCKAKYNNGKMAVVGTIILVLEIVCRWNGYPLLNGLPDMVPFLSAIALWMMISTKFAEKALANKIISWASEKSFLIYASHVLIGKLVIRFVFTPLVYSWRSYTGWQATIIMIITQVSVLICLYFGFKFSEKILPDKMLRVLSGGRGK